ncbi:MAG: hypothetical protein ACI4U3_03655 [Traorella sp.]
MKDIYLVISKTNSKLGKFIRLFTGTNYNHVSISFDGELNDMISFARYYYQIPFYGGYVHESKERYIDSKIIIYKIRISDDSYLKVQQYIDHIEKNKEQYIYHTINAILYPIHISIQTPQAYTCLSFACELLQIASLPSEKILTFKQLIDFLDEYKIYEGNVYCHNYSNDSTYMKEFRLSEKISHTYHQQKKLITRLFS